MHSIRMHHAVIQHNHGLLNLTVYGHSSIESVKQFILKSEKCPPSAIISIEDISTAPRTLGEVLRLL
jgi:hypothetical protein